MSGQLTSLRFLLVYSQLLPSKIGEHWGKHGEWKRQSGALALVRIVRLEQAIVPARLRLCTLALLTSLADILLAKCRRVGASRLVAAAAAPRMAIAITAQW